VPRKRDKDSVILQEARDNLTICDIIEKPARTEYDRCMQFIALKQWDEKRAGKLRRAGKPVLTVDVCGPICDQVINNWRRNRVAPKIGPGDAIATEATAKIFSGLTKNIMYASKAYVAIDSAFAQMVRGNRGYIGLRTKRRPGSFKQDIVVDEIPNAQCVYLDPFSKEIDYSDRMWGLKTDRLNWAPLKREFPKMSQTDFEVNGTNWPTWFPDADSLLVAEYWRVEEEARKIQTLTMAIPVTRKGRTVETEVVYDDEWDPDAEQFSGVEVRTDDDGELMEEDEPKRVIWQYLMTGAEILRRTRWLGKYIPIIPMYGKKMVVEGKTLMFSAISRSLDAQQEMNYAESAVAKELGSTVRVPFVGVLGQFKTQRKNWQNANIEDYAFLEYDPVSIGDKPAPPPTRQDHEAQIQALVMAGERAKNLVRETAGIGKTALGIEDHRAESGKAMNALQAQSDNGSFDYPAEGSRAVEILGCYMVDLEQQIYTQEEQIQILGDQDEQLNVLINADIRGRGDAPKDQTESHFLADGEYKVRVSADPSHATMREEAQDASMKILEIIPQDMQARLAPAILRLQTWFGAKELADRIELPEFKRDKDSPIPPEAQQEIQKGKMIAQELGKQLEQLILEKENKLLELESKERIAAMDNKTKLDIALAGLDQKNAVEGLRQEMAQTRYQLDAMAQGIQLQHSAEQADIDRQQKAAADQQAQQHQAGMAQSAQDHATGLQDSAQQHGAQLQDSAQQAAAQQAAQPQPQGE
jgi:hypothetical protein